MQSTRAQHETKVQQNFKSFVQNGKSNGERMLEFLVLSIAVFVSAKLLDGVEIRSFTTALGVALGISLVNLFIKPILLFLSLPVIILSLGLFIFIINAALILLIDKFVDGLRIRSFTWALIFSVLISVLSTGLNALL